jgi:hypothetical protein
MSDKRRQTSVPGSDPEWIDHGYGTRFQGFQNLMRHRIRDILLVSSLYDLYVFEEDGRLYELIRNEYRGLNLSHSPEIIRVSNAKRHWLPSVKAVASISSLPRSISKT